MVINYKKLNPNGFYLLKYLNDETIRFIILYGGSSSGKSYSVAQTILIQTLQDGENTLVMRKVGASILKTIYEDYKVAAIGLGISHLFKFQQNTIKCLVNGAKIDFSGLDDPEKIKGISNYKRVQLENGQSSSIRISSSYVSVCVVRKGSRLFVPLTRSVKAIG